MFWVVRMLVMKRQDYESAMELADMIAPESRSKTNLALLLGALLVLFCAGVKTSHAQLSTSLFLYNNYDYDFHDARGNALGRTEITSVLGANALFLNPANISFVRRAEVSINGVGSDLTNDIEYLEGGWGPTQTPTSNSILARSGISQIAGAMRLTMGSSGVSLFAGIGYNKSIDFNYTIESTKIPPSVSDVDSSVLKIRGSLSLVTIGGAISFKNGNSFGATYGFSVQPDVSTRFEYFVDDEVSYSLTSEKASARIFALSYRFAFSERVSVGAVYKKSSDLKVVERKFELGNFSRPIIYVDRGDETYQLPDVFGVGIQYNVYDKLMFVVEGKLRRYSDFSKLALRTGVEYKSIVSLRAGAFREPIPRNSDPVEGASNSVYGVTAGAGTDIAHIRANVYAQLSRTTLGFVTVDGTFLHRNTVLTAGFSLTGGI